MKAVNLLPGAAPVVAANPGKPNLGMIGGAAVGFVAIVAVAGYFAMARVDTVKSETKAEQAAAAKATSDTAAVRSQIESLGQPTKDSDRQLAQGAEQVLVSAYTERHDFPRFARELRSIMGDNGWPVKITASAVPGGNSGEETQAVKVIGYMPTKELAASMNERANLMSTMTNATITGLRQERMVNVRTKKIGLYWRFTMMADLVDTVAPSSGGAGGAAADNGDGTTVSSGSQNPTLSLDPLPPKPKRKPKAVATPPKPIVPAKPKNPFDVAVTVAGRGGAA